MRDLLLIYQGLQEEKTLSLHCYSSYEYCLKCSVFIFKLPQLFILSPVQYPNRHPLPSHHRANCCPLHQLAELLVTLATRPGSCLAPLAELNCCHFLIDSGLSFCLCSRFPIWQWALLFSAKAPEKRKRPNTLSLALRET